MTAAGRSVAANAGVEQAPKQIALPARADRREHAAAAGPGGVGILFDAPHDVVVFIEPDEIVWVERTAMRDEQRADLRSPGREHRVAGRIDEAIGIRPVRQQHLDHRTTACARRRVQRRAARRAVRIRPGRVTAIEQQARDSVVSEPDGGRQRELTVGPRLADPRGIAV